MIKKNNSMFLALRKENLRLKQENLRFKDIKILEKLFSIFLTALVADIGYTFNYFFDEVIKTKLGINTSKSLFCLTGIPQEYVMIKFYILLSSIIFIILILYIIWRRIK